MAARAGHYDVRIQFTKMHGLGNDFVVIDAIRQHVSLRSSQIVKLANRHTGVGFDQLLLIEPPSRPDADFNYRIFNSDGSEVEHCGNGARCFAKFVTDHGLITQNTIMVNTGRNLIELTINDDGLVRVNMGQPNFNLNALPYLPPPKAKFKNSVKLQTPQGEREFGLVSMGNPHAVTIVDNVENINIKEIGQMIQAAKQFPESINVGFLQIESRESVKLRVYERGAGETLACGTGACAAVAYARIMDHVAESVTVNTKGGRLRIDYEREGMDLIMIGPAESVFEGEFRL